MSATGDASRNVSKRALSKTVLSKIGVSKDIGIEAVPLHAIGGGSPARAPRRPSKRLGANFRFSSDSDGAFLDLREIWRRGGGHEARDIAFQTAVRSDGGASSTGYLLRILLTSPGADFSFVDLRQE